MAVIDLVMPKMGESIMEATVLTWLKKPGDVIEVDESLLEVATDKVDTEVPSTHNGILKEILVQEGEIAIIGKPICRLETTVSIENGEEHLTSEPSVVAEQLEKQLASHIEKAIIGLPQTEVGLARFYSPLVLSICKQEGITNAELELIVGTGLEGRVTKNDILSYVEKRSKHSVYQEVSGQAVAPSLNGTDDIIQMDRMRKMIAERMVESKRISAHVTSFVETDMTNIVLWREKTKQTFVNEYGENLTYTPRY